MIGRRSFFRGLFASAAAPAVVMPPVVDSGIAVDPNLCPHCGNMQYWRTISDFQSTEEWREYMTTPHEITCGNPSCLRRIVVQFARRVVNGRRI